MLIKKVKTVEMSLNFFLRITKLALLFDYKGAPIYKFSSFEIKKIPAEIPGDSLRFPFFAKMATQNEKNDNKKSLFMCPKSLSEGVFRDLKKKKKKKKKKSAGFRRHNGLYSPLCSKLLHRHVHIYKNYWWFKFGPNRIHIGGVAA